MNSVERRSAYQLKSFVEIKLFILHVVNETLKIEQSSVTFIAVIKFGFNAKLFEHEHTANAEEILLLDAVFPIATIKLVGDGTVKFAVEIKVSVKQIELHAAYIHTPDVGVDYAAGIRNLKHHGMTIGIHNLLNGKLVEVLRLVVSDLLTVNRKSLCKITVTIKEAHSGHIHAAVACFLNVVAGEHTKTAGVYFKTVAETILHREI